MLVMIFFCIIFCCLFSSAVKNWYVYMCVCVRARAREHIIVA
jgi:hypothetical protein